MKKLLLFGLALSIGFFTYAQKYKVKSSIPRDKQLTGIMSVDPIFKGPVLTQSKLVRPAVKGTKSTNEVTIITLGTSLNGYSYGYGGGNRTILWADDNLNTVVNIHRMGPPSSPPPSYSGYLSVDKSLDLGATFINNFQIYSATNNAGGTYYLDAARYPQGALFNPVGNTDPANVYITYFAPTLDGTNGADSWGGYALGVANLMDNSDSSKLVISSRPDDGIFHEVPDGMTVCQQTGDMWGAEVNVDWTSGTAVPVGSVVLVHGIFNTDAKKYDYSESLVTVPGQNATNVKIAFGPDGQTGYLAVLGDFNNLDSDSSYYPIVYKTTDGGNTWGDPVEVILSGPDGIYSVKNYLTDVQLDTLFGQPIPDRDDIAYTTTFDFDMIVDINGNPHIAVVIAPSAGGYSVPAGAPSVRTHAVFDITSADGGTTWNGQFIMKTRYMRHTFTGAAPAPSEDYRIQASTTMDGTKLFISWLETSINDPNVTGNDLPDIYTCGIDPIQNLMTDTVNVTYLSEAYLQAWCANASHYVFTDNDKYTIPYTYEEITGGSLDNPVTYKYIQDFSFDEADFINPGIGTLAKPVNNFTIGSAYPNPTSGISTIKVNLEKASALSLSVYNLTGQKVIEHNQNFTTPGNHELSIDLTNMNAGVYFYTVKAGENTVTKKLVLK